ncbi:putative integral membrane protein [Babesia bovis T2Bo]|uniref:putative integral membrane protein n=1 Tax=Babesia bovis T2Bo TaxID=484906 RepID=UPI001C364B4D|nr:putative integral membrane protein [Babesia bovis T2Bo]KAG6440120.1 putative integral membrane protein [Babesia bovis T2Bo]
MRFTLALRYSFLLVYIELYVYGHRIPSCAYVSVLPNGHQRLVFPLELKATDRSNPSRVLLHKNGRRHVNSLRCASTNDEPFAGSMELLDNSDLWSDSALDLSFQDMAAREVDLHSYQYQSGNTFRRIGAVAASVLIVGVGYGTLSLIRAYFNQQQAKLRAERYSSSGVGQDLKDRADTS